MNENRKQLSKIGMGFFVFAVLTQVLQLLAALFVKTYYPQYSESYICLLVISLIPMWLIAGPICFLIEKNIPHKAPEKGQWGIGRYIGGLVVAFLFLYTGNFAGTALGGIIEKLIPGAVAMTNNVQTVAVKGNLLANFIAMVIVAPICEELFFRKILVDRLRIYGDWVAILGSGLFFGLIHGNITQGTYAFVLGCLFAYIYLRTGNILITISYHMLINFWSGIVTTKLLEKADFDFMAYMEAVRSSDPEVIAAFVQQNAEGFAVLGIIGLGALVMGLTGLVILVVTIVRKRVIIEKGEIEIPNGEKVKTLLLNPGMMLFILTCLGLIAYATFSNLISEALGIG